MSLPLARATERASWTSRGHRGCGAGDREAWGLLAQHCGPAGPGWTRLDATGRDWTWLDPAGPGWTRLDAAALAFPREDATRWQVVQRFRRSCKSKLLLFMIQILATESGVKNSKIQTLGPTTPTWDLASSNTAEVGA